MSLVTRTSTVLLEGLKNPSDKDAWDEFDSRYRPLVLAVARRLGLAEFDADDAAQETMAAFVEAYRQQKYVRAKGRLRDWLCGIASHKIRDIQRKRGRQEKNIADKTNTTSFMNQIEDHDVENSWRDEHKKTILRQCLEEIRETATPKMYEAFQLYALQLWPAKRVAGHLQITEDVVYQNKRRILKRVREIMPSMEEIW